MKPAVVLTTTLTPGSITNIYDHDVTPPLTTFERVSVGVQKILLTVVSNAYFNANSADLKPGLYIFCIEYTFGLPINYSVLYKKFDFA